MPGGRPHRLAALAILAGAGLAAGACSPVADAGQPSLRREGATLIVTAPGWTESNVRGYLCPQEPGPGPEIGAEGRAHRLAAGCLDLGVAPDPDPSVGWRARLNLETLAAAQLATFAGRSTYRLVLWSVDEQSGVGFSTDVPAIDLVP